jgi:uncharacterized protein
LRGSGYDEVFGDVEDLSLTHYWDWTGFPAVSLPSGVGSHSGLPVSVSLIGGPGADWGRARVGRRAPGRPGDGVAVIDVAAVEAIDVHVHTEQTRDGHDPMPPELRAAAARYFRSDEPLPTGGRRRDVLPRAEHGGRRLHGRLGVAERDPADPERGDRRGRRREPDVLIPFASVDPARSDAVERARRLVSEHGVKGFKFHPNLQASSPTSEVRTRCTKSSRRQGCRPSSTPATAASGRGSPGGGGFHLKYSNPMCLEDVAADLPELRIVLAHPSFPWQDEAISVCLHKENVWIDLSGWSPKYFAPQLVQYANSQLRTKVLFGSDFPLITPDRWLADFAEAPFKDEVRPLILKENAARLLGLQDGLV